ncbi:MAG: class I SAM-dependent methyltransferase [Deltaproteobacteria bacterium]|nr:class I SAM-dependent methyltransferase [Deltaproteobacteria bacterium]MCL5278038.1 class I SAM-dependent methyltransferase [Deltaproteobacteria bacterium]
MTDNQKNSIVKKYGQPQEIRAFIDYSKKGLEAYEKTVFARMIKDDDVVLDLGCGAGREAHAVAALCSKVYALDLVHGMLRSAKGFVTENNVYFIRADATYLPVRDNSVDVVLMAKQFMNHITVSQRRMITMNEVYRVLKPGGRVYLTVHNDLFNIGTAHLLNGVYKIMHANPDPRKLTRPHGSGDRGADLGSLLVGFFLLRPKSIIVNAYRRIASKVIKEYTGKEAGDWEISRVSDAFSPFKSPYHNFTVKEISSLAFNAGFRIDEMRDIWELSGKRTLPEFLRKGAFTMALVLQKD